MFSIFHVSIFVSLPLIFVTSDIRTWFDLIKGTIKYDIILFDRNTKFSLWHVKMRALLDWMDLDDALLGFEKMPSSWTKEEEERKDWKALSQIHLHLTNQILQDVLKEKTATAL